MNGSRATSPRHAGQSSIGSLSRTIEGLEARIEGLMGGAKRSSQPINDGMVETAPRGSSGGPGRADALTLDNPLAAIRERQRMLGAARDKAPSRIPEARYEPADPVLPVPGGSVQGSSVKGRPSQERPMQDRPSQDRLGLRRELQRPAPPQDSHSAPSARPAQPAPRVAAPDASMRDIAGALVELRQQLKQDISEGVSREMAALRAEIRSIKSIAEEQHMADDLRGDLARLAESINHLGHRAAPEAAELHQEFEELRAAMGGLAREDSVRRIEDHWRDVEGRLQDSDPSMLREELISLAYRIEDIKAQLGAMADNPVVHALEQKLITIATAMEQLGSRMQPNDQAVGEQFALLDERLDEISRAIAAGSRATAAASIDHSMLQRLEGRIGSIAEQIDQINHSSAPSQTDILSRRIEALTGRMEELAEEQAAMRLEERLDHLSALMQQTQPDLGAYLADISRKIDGLEQGSVSDALAERLDYLATRIDGLEFQSQPQSAMDSGRFGRIEDRLSDIAARLDEAAAAPRGDEEALRSLEDQIAHLSSLISQPTQGLVGMSPELETRMVAIENYMATNDEYIIEAARQAAEAVVEAYSHTIGSGAPLAAADMAALTGLAEDLRHLEDLTRGSEERTHHTFEALHSTLVQIADRLDSMEHRFSTAPAQGEPVRRAEPAIAAAERLQQDMPAPAPSTRERLQSSAAYGHAEDAVALATPDTVTAPTREAGREASSEPGKASKPSLLQEISRRLRPGTRNEVTETTARAVVNPAPSIDPSDALPPERENDLLEPGTGAPDVKKILERVRASQAAGEFATERSAAGDRADYIAAARRAAKAAAQETDPAQGLKARRDTKSSNAQAPARKGVAASLSQHRRPIMMAVGAVLLALMAMPLVRTLTSPTDLAPPAAVEAPAQPQASAEPQAPARAQAQAQSQAQPQSTPSETSAETAPEKPNPFEEAAAPAQPAGEDSIAGGHLTDPQAAEGSASTFAPANPAPPANGFVAPPQAEAAPAIAVPAGIAPKSLADAAASGDPNALFEIGTRFTEGRGVQADPTEAAKWYKLAADKGLAPAQYRYGNLLEKGTGIARDLRQAADYYRKAAEAGNVSAMHNLAVLYASGATGQPDYAAAVQWFSQAADHGVADSQFNLAILFARGNGVHQDLEQSYKWFAIAAKGGDKDAAQKRDEVAKAMRKDQLDSARAKADQWQMQTPDPKANAPTMPDEWAASAKPLTTASIDMDKAIRNVQAILNKNGFDAGKPDGKMGQKTVAAIKAFQTSVGQEPNGRINDALVKALLSRNS